MPRWENSSATFVADRSFAREFLSRLSPGAITWKMIAMRPGDYSNCATAFRIAASSARSKFGDRRETVGVIESGGDRAIFTRVS